MGYQKNNMTQLHHKDVDPIQSCASESFPTWRCEANGVSGMDHVKNPSELFARNHACNAKKSGTYCSTGTQGTYS